MPLFNPLIEQLTQQLQQLNTTNGLVKLQAEIVVSVENRELVARLKTQTQFPHFFWLSRNTQLTLVTIGKARQFDTLEEADQFSRQTQCQLVGGLQFEGKCRFVLPRLIFAKNSGKLTACLYLNSQNLTQERQDCLQILSQLSKTPPVTAQDNPLISAKTACDFQTWKKHIEQAVTEIKQQQLNKVVLANAKTLTFEKPLSAYDLLTISLRKNIGCYHFLWAEDGNSAFIGSSPERLYLRQDRRFYTEALAGTVAVTENTEETERNALWLLSDHKNIYENLLVVDDICTHLADCAEDIEVGEAEIKRLHNVQHLRRKIRTVLAPQVTDANCLARIHPTAAVAGLPRSAAKQFIRQHEPFERGWYAGALGYFTPQSAEFCVTLRSALIEQNRITVYAGAGIVEESEAESEWAEIERKSLAMASLFVK
ncbi:isochorismate synthase MenF [Glaesserella sp.]|uniref:isochorismate synthase n=1 Tax=Glaesserella sp. TaxID=2094731 RepID=UPI0035A174F6